MLEDYAMQKAFFEQRNFFSACEKDSWQEDITEQLKVDCQVEWVGV